MFMFEFNGLINSPMVNKWSILKLATKIFDSLGLVSPFVIQLEVLFQNQCIQQVNWNKPMVGELLLMCSI